jgi:glycosyltransferase involved in cell wall biosynthesis
VIARLNAGGPAYHVSLLSGRLDPSRYETLLVAGEVGPGEVSMDRLAERYGAQLQTLSVLGPELRLKADVLALRELTRIARRFRPHIVHTHTAKAGFLGRLAACAVRPRPIIVHTYHGHVLEGYFGVVRTALYRLLERAMARLSDRLIAVSSATVDDLVRLGVGARDDFAVVPVGLDLDPFGEDATADERLRLRRSLGCREDEVLATYVGRLVPIKRLDIAIEATALARRGGAPLRLAIVGEGKSRVELERHAERLGVADAVTFLGYRSDVATIIAATDIAVLSSDNEGTPVFLIEAAAGRRPAVATAVGGVPDVVTPGSGLLVSPGNPAAMAGAIGRLVSEPLLREEMGTRAEAHVRDRFDARRLVADIDRLYRDLLDSRARTGSTGAH